MSRTQIEAAFKQIQFSRRYTKQFLSQVEPADWFWQPTEGVTHLAWQVGHLAFAQYSLCVKRTRGPLPEDEALISTEFLRHFGRDSIPQPGAENNLPPAEIVVTFDRVFEYVQTFLPTLTDEDLSVVSLPEHRAFQTKLGALFWAAQHELVHAGQIALLRRLRGNAPLW